MENWEKPLLERLRMEPEFKFIDGKEVAFHPAGYWADLLEEAADEIERLQNDASSYPAKIRAAYDCGFADGQIRSKDTGSGVHDALLGVAVVAVFLGFKWLFSG